MKNFLDPMPKIVAHRGDSHNYPENTMDAFLSAIELEVDVIETDVHLTKDNKIVIWHDDTLDRNTDGKGKIEDYTYQELLNFDAGYTFTSDNGKTFPFRGKGVKIALLEEVLNRCPNQRFNIDLKTPDIKIVDYYLDVIRKAKAENRICSASFSAQNLKTLRKKAPDLLTSSFTSEVLCSIISHFFRIPYSKNKRRIMQVPERSSIIRVISPSYVKWMHKYNHVIQVWTINEEEDMRRLLSWNVDSIMSDNPRLLKKVISSLYP